MKALPAFGSSDVPIFCLDCYRSAMRITVNAWSDLVFPGGDKDAVKITNNDYLLLNTDAFVNDTIVDFYIK